MSVDSYGHTLNCTFHDCINKSGLLFCRQLNLQQAHNTSKGMYKSVSTKVTTSCRSRLGEYNINLMCLKGSSEEEI